VTRENAAMRFKAPIWPYVAFALTALNVAGAGYAVALAEPMHAAAHVVFAFGFGWWAQRLRQRRQDNEWKTGIRDTLENPLERLATLEADVSRLQQELSEVQERMDFTERILARGRESGPGA
jgi:Tfp pilus assembly protein PilO